MIVFFVIVVCLVLNAFFACFEMAFVTVSKPQVRALCQQGKNSAAAHRLLKQRENPERTLSVVQIGITLVGMLSAAVGGAGAEQSVTPILKQMWGLSDLVTEIIAIAIVVLPLTYFSAVLSELVPKAIALRYARGIALRGAAISAAAERLLSPFVSLLEHSTKLILKLILPHSPLQPTPEANSSAVDLDGLSGPTRQYVMNLVSVEERRVRDLMLPWKQVRCVNDTDITNDVLGIVLASGHTRLPVLRDGQVLGLLHTKEFLAMLATEPTPWMKLLRPIIFVEEQELALRVLRRLQQERSHLAVVLSADQKPTGIVTFEDVMEEVVGEFFDEDDDGRIRKLMANSPKFPSIIRRY